MLKIECTGPRGALVKATWNDDMIPLLLRIEIATVDIRLSFVGDVPVMDVEEIPLEVLDPERAAGKGPPNIAALTGESRQAPVQDLSRNEATIATRDRIIAELVEAGYKVEKVTVRPKG
jgi:hypothetical protein